MTDALDMDLVREFARNHSEAAFTELVRRHLNLVYSIARRCTGNDDDAQDVTQAVFAILARKAAGLHVRTVLPGWLYETTRNTAACLQRTNARRHAREQEAYMQSTLTGANTAADWHRLAPHLEAAMSQLGEGDRTLLALRFYQNKSGPEAAALLGIREAAAHKRTARALEKLRKFFTRRGVELSAVAIAGAVSANSVQAAPAGLAAVITAAAFSGTTITATTLISVTKAIAMTTLQKTLITAAFIATVSAGIYAAKEAAQARAEAQSLQQQRAPLAEELRQLQASLTDATNRLAGLRDELANVNRNNLELLKLRAEVTRMRQSANNDFDGIRTNHLMDAEVQFWVARVKKLKDKLQQLPEKQIPEFQFMTEHAWMFSSQLLNSDSDSDFENAIKSAQACAKRDFADSLYGAIKKFMADNSGRFPADFSQIQPYFDKPANADVFQRYEIMQARLVPKIISDTSQPAKSVQYVYQAGNAGSDESHQALPEAVVMEKTPLYAGDAQIVVSATGVQLQSFQ